MTTANRGYITVATRHRRYLEMAVDMALSLREHNPDPISIVVDNKTERLLNRHYAGIFDQVILLPNSHRMGFASKLFVARASPYDYTLFLDADALVFGSFSRLWFACRGLNFGLIGETLVQPKGRRQDGFMIKDLMAEFQMTRFLKNNSSVFFFEKHAGMQFLDEAFQLYRDQLWTPQRRSQSRVGDQIALGIVGGRQGLDTISAVVPFYWPHELPHLMPADLHKPMVTFLNYLPSKTKEWLIDQTRQRRKAAGVRSVLPIHWWIKMNIFDIVTVLAPEGTARRVVGKRMLRWFGER